MDVAKEYPDVAHVAVVIRVCFNSLFKNVSSFYTYVAYVANGNVASVCSEYFIYFRRFVAIVSS
jgi:hypothetical protein